MAAEPAATRQQMDWLTLTDTNSVGPTLRKWQRRCKSRLGRWLFTRAVCRHAPYLATLSPRFIELRPALCKVAMPKRKPVQSTRGTVHELAIGNLCEFAASMVTEVTIPPAMRWSARGMTIEYLRRADSEVTAIARLDKNEWGEAQNVSIPVSALDAKGMEVVRAVVTMYVSPR